MRLNELTIHEAHAKLSKKEISSEELTEACLETIDKKDKSIFAFITKIPDQALKQAKEIDEKISHGEKVGPLAGIPVAIKDNMCIDGVKTTAGSKMLENFISPYDATVIKKLREAGAIFLGKTNMDEFAMGSSTENSYLGPTKNPHDLERVPGGSSGGSAASVASNETIYALGSDTGGSIRQPASFCGVIGLKPTYSRVSRFGLIAMASSLDQIGPITKDVEDASLVLNAISGKDKLDSTSSVGVEVDFRKSLVPDIRDVKIGIPKEYFAKGIDLKVKKMVQAAIDKLESLGAKIRKISLPHTEYALACYYIIMPSEISANLARYDGIKFGYSAPEDALLDVYLRSRGQGFGDEVRRRIMLGTFTLSAGYWEAYYLKAQKVRTLIRKDFDQAFKKVDVIITPTSPTVAFKIGEKVIDPLTMYLSDMYTVSANLAGIPGISIPCGFVKTQKDKMLPVGLQILGKHFDEEMILRVAYTYEQNTR